MSVRIRSYHEEKDCELVGDFLIDTYQPGENQQNWLQPRWEYMHYTRLPFHEDQPDLKKIGIFEDSGNIVGVVHFEDSLGDIYFEIHPDFTHLKSEMLTYAENHLYAELSNGRRYVRAFINDFDSEFELIAQSRGYKKDTNSPLYTSQFTIPDPFPPITVPDGFSLQSLEDENDFDKINRVLYRGFNHPGEPREEDIEYRKRIQMAPNFRKDLTIVVEAPDGNFASFCGIWYVKAHKIAYVEPVATDPDYRFMGLGKAAVLESIRRCGELGATVAFVGSGQTFYEAIGFRKIFAHYLWRRYF
jgi:predicted N-acetyltransferase YhbS